MWRKKIENVKKGIGRVEGLAWIAPWRGCGGVWLAIVGRAMWWGG